MKSQHINPEEAYQIHKAVNAEYSLGIHWGTYKMGSTEPYDEPPKLFKEAARQDNQSEKLIILGHGETWDYKKE